MFSRPVLTAWRTSLGLVSLAFTMLVIACGQGSVAQLNISDDMSFRRAMLKSTAVFAFECPESALEHWSNLWSVSSSLDVRTRNARRDLLVTAVEPLLEKATAPGSTLSIERMRDRLEVMLDDPQVRGAVSSDARCDWIVLNRLLGDNDRTIEWMMQRCRMASMSRLPKRVRELASTELAGEVEWDESCNCPIYQGDAQSVEL